TSVQCTGSLATSESVLVCVRLPLRRVSVSVSARAGGPVPVVTDRVEDAVAGFGAKLPLAPLGSPPTLRLTWPLKPPVGLMVTLRSEERRGGTDWIEGGAPSAKVTDGLRTNETITV